MTTDSRPMSVMFVAQTPPPYHGQAIMGQLILDGFHEGKIEGFRAEHIRMSFSDSMNEVGLFKFRKISQLFALIVQTWVTRLRSKAKVLYYPPAGPNTIPILRDVLYLLAVRWMFKYTVYHFHASGLSEKLTTWPLPLRLLAKFAYRRPDIAIQLSPSVVADGDYLQAKQIVIVPNAVPDYRAQPFNDKAATDPVNLLYLGTVCEGKGFLTLLNAIQILRSRGVANMHLHVVGSFDSDAFRDEVSQLIRAFDIKSLVTFHGQKTGEEKQRMYELADIFCFPSHYSSESFGCVLIEAMSNNLPVVATNWRAIPLIVDHEETGLLVEIKDANAMADALSRLIGSPELRASFGATGRRKYEREYTVDRLYANMQQVFSKLD